MPYRARAVNLQGFFGARGRAFLQSDHAAELKVASRARQEKAGAFFRVVAKARDRVAAIAGVIRVVP